MKAPSNINRYISTLQEKHKKRDNIYSSDMKRCDLRVPVITPASKYQNLLEIIKYAEMKFEQERHNRKE